jgi:5'-nucleotidase
VTSFLEATGEFRAVEPDATMQKTLAVFQSEVEVLKQSIVGAASATLCLERAPGGGHSTMCHTSDTWQHGSQIGQVVARAFLTVTHTADVAIQNAGGVRADLPAGNVSIDDCITVLPFSNTLVVAQMTGAQIKSSIEDALANFIEGGSDGSYPIASGLRFRVDASKARGSRVSRLQTNPKMYSFWDDISATRTYSVVTNSYLASGKDGYATFGGLSFENTFTEYAQALINHVEQVGVVHAPSASDYSTQVYVDVTGCNHSAVPYSGCPTASVHSGTIALSMSRLLRGALAAALGLETLRLW